LHVSALQIGRGGAGCRLPADVDAASTTCDAARRVLAGAKQPLKFVTNFCYAGDGTVKMFHLIQNWWAS
jgi:hypothetical protein